MTDLNRLLDAVENDPRWTPESVGDRAISVLNSNAIRQAAIITGTILLVTVVVLVGIMIGRRDPDISSAVRHLFTKVDSERLPVLPANYPGTSRHLVAMPDLLLVVGDSWAGGFGVQDTAVDSWWAQLKIATTVQRSVNATARVVDVPSLIQNLHLPSTLQGRRIALLVQCGWNELFGAADVMALATQLVAAIKQGIAAQPALSKVSTLYVYLVDYPDASAGTGVTQNTCAAPLNQIYNHPTANIHLLEMWSRALLLASHAAGYAFVPLRTALGNVAATGLVRAFDFAHRPHPVGVNGHPLADPVPPAFIAGCTGLAAEGQRYQSDLIAAYLTNTAYFIVG